jgi:hypothetical protein
MLVAASVVIACGKPAPGPAAVVVETAPAPSSNVQAVRPSPPATSQADAGAPAKPCTAARLEVHFRDDPQAGPLYNAVLTNTSRHPVTLVRAGTGSEEGLRPPTIRWKVTKLDGTPVTLPSSSAPIIISKIDDDDVVDIQPGEVLELYLDGPDLPAGTFRVRLVYENDPKQVAKADPDNPHSALALARAGRSSPCRVESNAIVRVIPRVP